MRLSSAIKLRLIVINIINSDYEYLKRSNNKSLTKMLFAVQIGVWDINSHQIYEISHIHFCDDSHSFRQVGLISAFFMRTLFGLLNILMAD